VHVYAIGSGTPPVPTWLVIPGEYSIILLVDTTFSFCSLPNAFKVDLTIFAHYDTVLSRPNEPTRSLVRLVRNEFGVFCCKLKWDHVCPTEIDDTSIWCVSSILLLQYVSPGLALPLNIEIPIYDDVVTRQIPVKQHMRRVIKIRNPEFGDHGPLLFTFLQSCSTYRVVGGTTDLSVNSRGDPVPSALP
jgi:hypothetical protein